VGSKRKGHALGFQSGGLAMTLLQDSSRITDTSAYLEIRPHGRKRILSALLTVVLATSAAAATLGWVALLVRGAVWLEWS
jgi:hypothetical protein